jgi:uncharacterized protein (TIGR00661 family)
MSTIFYSLAGEGRGHATRVRTIVEHLRSEHRFVIFAPGDAFDMLDPLYAGTDVRVVRIPGLGFEYDAKNALSPWRTTRGALAYIARLPKLLARLDAEFERERPALVVTDFEPSLPRAAARRGIPFVSLNHQHFLVTSDFSHLPKALQLRAAALGKVVDLYYHGQASTIVSSFCFPPLRKSRSRVVQVGPLLRPSVLAARPEVGSHLIVYLRKFGSERLLEALAATGREVRTYGLGAQPSRGNVHFFPIDERRFVEDLATSYALVTTAGNQLLGEALYLQKPVFALPEPNNAEQLLHGHLLARERTGEWLDFTRVDATAVYRFLARVEFYRSRIDRERLCGNRDALAELRRHLGPATLASAPKPPAHRLTAGVL